jgi:hypothetical protein
MAVRISAMLICALFVAVFLFSAAFIALHAGHEHDHVRADGGCAVCANIAAAGNLLKTVFAAAAATACAVCQPIFTLLVLKAARRVIAAGTLISMKIRIDS